MATAVHVVRPEDASSIAVLAAAIPFAALDEKEALYAHAVAGACWGGAPICSLQCSVESVPLLALLRAWLGDRSAEEARAAAVAAGVALADVESFAAFASNLIDNLGNYRSFGDTKMVPAVSAAAFETVLRSSPGWGPGMSALWAWSGALAYDMRPRLRQLGWGPTAGISTYYSASIVETDAAIVQKLLDAQRQPQPYNTRIFKLGDVLQLRLASAATGAGPPDLLLGSHDVDGTTVEVVRGDYAPLMGRVVACLERAREHAANENQVAALDGYISSFSTGSQSAFIAGSAAWVRDKGPVVESYIGFIESYKDPSGTRGEWEGFVACVNKVQSAQFGALVAAAEPLIAQLPWGSTFEKDSFLRPDFTSLEVLAFASSGIPGGINIPNFDSLRQDVGFKNVSLSNVLSARNTRDHVTFLADADQDVFNAKVSAAFGIQVGLHELLGHGSGKTFVERADGSFNFDKEAVEAQLGGPVGHYKPGQSWDSVFGGQASTMEECRAEAVGLYLCVLPEVQAIFGAAHGSPSEAHAGTGAGAEADISYVNWLNMARAGLLALQFYSPATKVWGQAHMQARYALLRVLLDANVARLVGTEGLTAEAVAAGTVQEGEAGVHVTLDRTLITSRGLPAIGAFLRKLQELKSSADAAEGLPWYARATAVPDAWLPLRDLVIAKRKPRQMFVQPVLETAAETAARGPVKNPGARVVRGMAQAAVTLIEFPATVDGLLDAFARRYPARDEELLRIWEAEAELHLIPA